MSEQLLIVKDKVQRYLTEIVGNVEIDNEGDLTFRHESVRMFCRCGEWGDDKTVVNVWSILLVDLEPTPEIYKYVAEEGSDYFFGALKVATRPDEGKANLVYGHTLLGDFLDLEELKACVLAMTFTANDLDDELQKRFGGQRFHED